MQERSGNESEHWSTRNAGVHTLSINPHSAKNGSGVEEVIEAVARISLLPKRRDSANVFDGADKFKKKNVKGKSKGWRKVCAYVGIQ
jgi:hypothetical protein